MGDDKAKIRDDAEVAFIRARLALRSTHPFYAHLSLKLGLQWREDCQGGLSATDGKTIFVNPSAFLALPKNEQPSVIVHEVWHCAAGHPWRCGSRDPFRFNVAGDVAIANALDDEKLPQVQAGEAFMCAMGIDRRKFVGMNVEEIYEKLPANVQQPQCGQGQPQQGNGNGKGGGTPQHWNGQGGCYHPAPDKADSDGATDAQWKQNVIEAAQQAGNAPGAWRELVDAATPKVPFTVKLHEFLTRGMGGDTSFDSFNRRHVYQGMYLPNETRFVMGEVAVCLDTSGSMSTEMLQEALGYIRGFREEHPCTLHFIQCDYDVPAENGYKKYNEWERLPQKFDIGGRGGTSFDAPFRLMAEKRIKPKVVIYCTDAFGSVSAESKPSCDVLWVVIKGGDSSWKPPFGTVCVVK